MKFWMGILLLLAPAAPARAEWHEAQTDHFVVYSNSGAEDLRRLASLLERYHSLLVMVTGMKSERPSPSARLTIYALGSDDNLRELYGNRRSAVAGFYLPRASGSVAYI